MESFSLFPLYNSNSRHFYCYGAVAVLDDDVDGPKGRYHSPPTPNIELFVVIWNFGPLMRSNISLIFTQ